MENTTEIMEELNTEIEMDELIDLIEYICLRV